MHFGREPGKWTLTIVNMGLMENDVRQQFIPSTPDRGTKSRSSANAYASLRWLPPFSWERSGTVFRQEPDGTEAGISQYIAVTI